jgi:hypothetical protein
VVLTPSVAQLRQLPHRFDPLLWRSAAPVVIRRLVLAWPNDSGRDVGSEGLFVHAVTLALSCSPCRGWHDSPRPSHAEIGDSRSDLWAIEIQRGLAPKPGRCIHQACTDFGLPLRLARPCRSETLRVYDAALWAFPRLIGRRAKRQGSHGNDNE